jgi:hypothetical protein
MTTRNHRNAAAQTNNSHGRKSIGRGAVTKLQKQTRRQPHNTSLHLAPQNTTLENNNRKASLGLLCCFPSKIQRRRSTPHKNETATHTSRTPIVVSKIRN